MDQQRRNLTPDNPELGGISQLDDNSGLSTLYPQAKVQWTGEIMSAEERAAKKQAEVEAITKGIRRKSVRIGLLAPIPFFLAAIILVTSLTFVTKENITFLLVPIIIATGLWGVLSFLSIRSIFRIFYDHAFRGGSLFVILLVLLGVSIQSLFVLTLPIHTLNPIKAVLVISAGVFVLSMVLSFLLLVIWTSTKLNGGVKLTLITLISLALIAATTAMSIL